MTVCFSLAYHKPAFYKTLDNATHKLLYASNIFDMPDSKVFGPETVLQESPLYGEDCTRLSAPPKLCTPWKKVRSTFFR